MFQLTHFRLVALDYRRCRTAKYAYRSRKTGIHSGGSHGMIERRLGLIVGRVVAFICNDQTEIGKRRKQCTAGTDDQLQRTTARPPPGIVSLPLRKLRMDDTDLARKAAQKAADRLRRKGNFWHQNNGLPAELDSFLRGAQIDLGLARAGNPSEEKGGLDLRR